MSKRNVFTDATDDQIKALYGQGMGHKDIADTIGFGKTATSNRIRHLGLSKAKPRQLKWTPEMDATIRRYINVLTRGEIAKKIGKGATAAAVISRAARLNLQGVSPVAPQPWTAEEDQYLRDRVGSLSQRDMAEELGRERSSVFRRLEKLGIKPERAVVTYIAPKAVKPSQDIPLTARPWLTRTSRECKYLYGQRHAYLACCEPVWGDTGHCEAHAALCGGYKKVAA